VSVKLVDYMNLCLPADSVSYMYMYHCKNLNKRVGLVQNLHHYHLIKM